MNVFVNGEDYPADQPQLDQTTTRNNATKDSNTGTCLSVIEEHNF